MANTPQQSEFRHTASNAGIIAATTTAAAVFGFVLQQIIAYHFGANEVTDSYVMAQSTSELLSKLLMGGSITAVFIPLFVERLTHNRNQEAWHLALNIFHLLTLAYIILLVLIGFFTEPFVTWIAPGFSIDQVTLTTRILRVLLPSFFFLFLVEFFTSILHSFRIFTLPALMRLVTPIISILSLLLLVSRYGIFSLAFGVLIGSMIQFILLLIGLKRQGLSYRFIFQPSDPVIKKVLSLIYPFIFSVIITQAAGIVYRILVSDLDPGSYTSIKNAEKITQLLSNVFLASLTLVIYPLLSRKASQNDRHGMHETVASTIRLIFFITVPIIIGVSLLRFDIISTAYGYGEFDSTDIAMTSAALLYLVIGLTTNGLSSVLGHTVLAFQKTKFAVFVTIITQISSIAFFYCLVPLMGLSGLALASSLGPLVSSAVYYLYLRDRLPHLYRIFIHSTYLKTILLSTTLAGIVLILKATAFSTTPDYLTTFGIAAIGSAAYFLGAHLLHIPEMRDVSAIAAGKLAKWQGKT